MTNPTQTVDRLTMRLAPWAIPILTLVIFVADVLTPVGVAVSILYVLPLLLTFLYRGERELLAFSLVATMLLWVDLLLKPPGIPMSYAVFNRVLGTIGLWGITLGLGRYTRARQGLAKAEEQLAASLLRLEGVVQSAMDAIITVDDGYLIVLFNRAAEDMFGCRADEATGRSLDRFIPSRFRDAHRRHIKEFRTSGSTSRKMGALGQVTGLRASGEEFPIEAAISQIEVEGKRLFTVILRDLTERLRVEAALTEEQRTKDALILNLPGVVYRCRNEPDWPIEYISDQALNMFGYSPDEFATKAVLYPQLILEDDRIRVWEGIQAALALGEPYRLEYRVRRRDGRLMWVWEQGRAVPSSNDDATIVEGFISDITIRKQAERLSQAREERYRRLLEVSPDAIVINRDERIVFINQQGVRLLGADDASQVVGRSIEDFVHPDFQDQHRQRIREVLHGVEHRRAHEEQFVRVDGTAVWVEVSVARFEDEEGTATQSVIRDVTKRKRLEEQLRRTERIAELGTLASGMAHEIGTPMNVILGRAEYLLQRATDDLMTKGLTTIITQVERITRVMNQLLAFARRRSPERRAVDLRHTVVESLEMFRERLGRKRIVIETLFDDPLPMVNADPDQMAQVLINLIMNSVHAMPEGGRLQIKAFRADHQVTVEVNDTGHGISPEVLAKVFDPFFTTKDTGQGTGLGLTVVKGIVEEHGGTISVSSDIGKQTTVRFSIPMIDAQAVETV